jgi:hypothetical protein
MTKEDQMIIATTVYALAKLNALLASMTEQNVQDREAGRPLTYAPHHFARAPDDFGLVPHKLMELFSDNRP